MKNFTFAYAYEFEAIFRREEYGFAKHAHNRISKLLGSD